MVNNIRLKTAILAAVLAAAMAYIHIARITAPNAAPAIENNPREAVLDQVAGDIQTDIAENKITATDDGGISDAAVTPSAEAADYLGEYSYDKEYDNGPGDSGVLDVIEMSSGEITFNLSLFNYQLHMGDVRGGKAKLNGNVAVYEHKDDFRDDVCRLEITFTSNSATIKTVETKYRDASCGFGMNVFADGVYAKQIGSTPGDFTKFADYVPSGWQILAKLEGDLNKDGISDAALVIEDAVENKTTLDWQYCADRECVCAKQKCARKLMLFFGKNAGGYELSLESDKAILLADEGGAYGDPFQRLGINNGSILLEFYGGSTWRWDERYRFRYQEGGWYLIGRTAHSYHSGCPYEVFRILDHNYLTGRTEVTTGAGWYNDNWKEGFECNTSLAAEAGTSTWTNDGLQDILNLKDFDPRNN